MWILANNLTTHTDLMLCQRACVMQTNPSASRALLKRAARVFPPCVYGTIYGRIANPTMPPGGPQFFNRANGARLWDVDGREYIDFLCAYGPNLLGYGHPR